MHHSSLNAFLSSQNQVSVKAPIAMIFVEDEVEIDTTVRHHLNSGFNPILVFMPESFELSEELSGKIHRIDHDLAQTHDVPSVVNQMITAFPSTWMYYCFNAEYLFFPFCETRTIGEMLAFHTEERRDAMVCYVVDLYAEDLIQFPNAVSLETAHLDKSGYYALARLDPANHNHPKERQLDFHGGLRWRFEEHVPQARRKIDRIALFKSQPGLVLRENHTFNSEEYNTYACPWHHNLTAAIMSFRVAKALKRNPGSSCYINTLKWQNSILFEWDSRQLLDLGVIEPGQWF
ncbi:hypothetical protein ROA7450_02552 [Roseovarius albus]|uniref:Glycosyl transferase family 2 n=1 Tax=Roseovarius albus TaxID=1247867 RepID=A0A1X6ZH51_9RHOB|nr:hypothetical protein [Roseovarius albus]SLN51095.1 hypothetical protein ROA7450_02552 [Roseovarius albus]